MTTIDPAASGAPAPASPSDIAAGAPPVDEAATLKALGHRIRMARARRGMSRRILSRDSGVSERYLAQLEAGEANVSIVLLHQIARAMGLPVTEVVADEPERPVELALALEVLQRLGPEQQTSARRLLQRSFGVDADNRASRVGLIGLRGAGKSTLGQRLAKQRGVPFVELDREIARTTGMDLAEVFQLFGQSGYRRLERRCLEGVIEHHAAVVIATGGSLVTEPGTFDLLLSACFVVWIRASPQEHMTRVLAQGDHRPMADNSEAMEDLKAILASRAQLYAKADASVDTTDRDIATSFAALVAAVP